jgi:hypothetical protein
MQRDPGPLGKHVDRSEGRQHRQHPFEGSTYGGILAIEVGVDRAQRGAGMCVWFTLAKVRPHLGQVHSGR